jgi:DNA-binding transcriptional LysR family regulator
MLSVRSDLADSLPSAFGNGMLDLAIDYLHFKHPDLCYQPLIEEQMAVIARSGHPALANKLTLAGYQDSRHVAIPARVGRGSPLEILLGSAKVHRQIQLYVPYYLTIPQIVAQSDLLGTVPRRLAEYFAKVLPLQVAPLPVEAPPVQVNLIWHRQQDRAPGLRWLRGRLAAIVAEPILAPLG